MSINRKKTVVIWITILCVLFFALFWRFAFFSPPKPSKEVIEHWQLSNSKFGLSVTVYGEENNKFVPGAYYTYEVFTLKSGHRRKIFTIRHDDPIPIDKNSLNFVNEDIAFVYMGWMFAVTTDGGISWLVWDGSKQEYLKDYIDYNLINSVNISRNGAGKMELNTNAEKREKITLTTNDFGQHWKVDS